MPESNGHEDFQPIEDKELGVEPLQSWGERDRDAVPWIPDNIRFGKTVKPPNEQSRPLITNEQVLQSRDEPVGKSMAFPIRSGENRSVDFSPTLNKRQDH